MSEKYSTLVASKLPLFATKMSQHKDKELFKRARVDATFPALAAACRAVLRLAVSSVGHGH